MTFTVRDAVEPFQEVDVEQLGMQQRTFVLEGGAITLDPTDLTYDIEATTVVIDGVRYELAAATNAGTLVPGSTQNRWAQVLFDKTTPSFELVHGSEAANPAKPAVDFTDRCLLAQLLLQPSDSVATDVSSNNRFYDKRIIPQSALSLTEVSRSLHIIAQHRGFFMAGGVATSTTTPAVNSPFGLGCTLIYTGTSAGISRSTALRGGTRLTAGQNGYMAVVGPAVHTSDDLTIMARIAPSSDANGEFFLGLSTNTSPLDADNRFGIRYLGTGNIFAFSDSGGSETAQDSGVAPTGAAKLLRVEMRNGGTLLRCYLDNVQIGADITTNIPAITNGNPMIGRASTAVANPFVDYADFVGYQEAA